MLSSLKFTRPKRKAEQVAFAKRLYDLLQRPARGKPQNGRGYSGHIRLWPSDFEDHLFGGSVFAVACVNEDGCNFFAFDCDEWFAARLPIYAKVLEGRGLAKAAFATTGSTRGRGKVVVTLANRISQSYAVELAKAISAEVIALDDFGMVKSGTLTAFPSAGNGSHCRIGGSKYGPHGRPDVFIDLNSHKTDLTAIEPATVKAPSIPTTSPISKKRPKATLSTWAQTILAQPFTGTEPNLVKTQLRLASEAIQVYGQDAKAKFGEWMD